MSEIQNPELKKAFDKAFTYDTICFFVGFGMIVYRFGWFDALALRLVFSSLELGAIRGSISVGDIIINKLKAHDKKPRGYEHK